jgi:3-dehydroquinate synthase
VRRSIGVDIPGARDRSYRIYLQPGMLPELPDRIAGEVRGDGLFVITDSTVERLYGRRFLQGLASRIPGTVMLDIPPGEPSKTFRYYSSLVGQLLAQRIQRESLIVALGGGVVGDIGGFVAATLLRGVRFVQVPTTLLAQVDSSVGGKVGIDHRLGKNLIGAFHQPAAVYIDPDVLKTLPVLEFRNGLAEIVKIALALDGGLFRKIERNLGRIEKTATSLLADLITGAVSLKAAVVARDEREAGLRKTLNLGHTVGHAVESAMGYSLTHGAAVAMGLAAESRIAVRMGLLRPAELERIIHVLRRLKLPVTVPREMQRSTFAARLALDKKVVAGKTQFVLPAGIGVSAIGVEVPTEYLFEAIGRGR